MYDAFMTSDKRPLVIVNGLGAPDLSPSAYGVFFKLKGYRIFPVTLPYLGWGDIRRCASVAARAVDSALTETGARRVDMIGLSLGGIIGLYYVKCGGGAERVRRLISLGGPLNGSPPWWASLGKALRFVPVLRQLDPQSELIRQVRDTPTPTGVEIISLGARGDPMTPRESRHAPGVEVVDLPGGCFPLGHYALLLDPRNLGVVLDLLQRD